MLSPYKAILAFFVLLSLNSSSVFATEEKGNPINFDETSNEQKITSEASKIKAEDLRPKGVWTPYPSSFPKGTLAEQFPNLSDFQKHWKVSKSKKGAGGKVITEDEALYNYNGKWAVEEPTEVIGVPKGDLGLVLKTKAAHSAISRKLDQPLTFDSSELVVIQYEVKLQDGLECGGAYMKLLSASKDFNPDLFTDLSPYTIMFGPDKCGATNKVHFIFRHQNKKTKEVLEHHLKYPPTVPMTSSKETHLYTLLIEPTKNQYDIWIDGKSVKSGSLLDDFEPAVVPPKEIPDPEAKKPSDWVDQEEIVDTNAKKPDDWDESAPFEIEDMEAKKPDDWLETESAMIVDPEAKKPSSWDEEQDGEWEPNQIPNPKCKKVSGCGPWKRPMKRNPNYKGKWKAPMIPNPAFKGKWKAPMIPNPMYIEDSTPGLMTPIGAIGFELWTMQNEILFDNILLSNTLTKQELQAWNAATFEKKSQVEKAIEKLSEPKSPDTDSPTDASKDTPLPLAEQFQFQNLMAFFPLLLSSPLRAWNVYPMVSVLTVSGSVFFVLLLLFTFSSNTKKSVGPTKSVASSKATKSSSSSSSASSDTKSSSAAASGMKKSETDNAKLRPSAAAKKMNRKAEQEEGEDGEDEGDEKENFNQDSD